MPSFCQPFDGMRADRKLSNEELVRAIRFMIAAEYEAVELYMQLVESIDNKMVQDALKEIANDERVHAGCFLRILKAINPEEESYYQSGAKEMEEKFINRANAKDKQIVRDELCDND